MHRLTSAPPPPEPDPEPPARGDDASHGEPSGRRERGVLRRSAGMVLPAALGAGIAVAALAAAGVLDGESTTTTIVREPADLAVSEDASAPPAAPLPGATADRRETPAAPARPLPQLVADVSPAVVKVTSGEDSGRLGSGFVVDDGGRILTNEHVLADEDEATVTFADGSDATATVLGRDASTDLAVLDAERLPPGVEPVPLGTSAGLEVGSGVVAIGNPFGLERTATTGIVSAIERVISAPNSFRIQNAIQTDAAINQGNSGGPLLDLRGRVVGINSQIATERGGNVGIGFAVPIDTVRPVAESIIETGEAEHAWIGITGRSLNADEAIRLGAPASRGVAITDVDDRGPAADSGLRPAPGEADAEEIAEGGDLIVAADGRPVSDMADVSRAVSSRRVGEQVRLGVLRDGERISVVVPLVDRPEDVGVARP
jgi:putative serine protease PepD